jgi:hypothetical protein
MSIAGDITDNKSEKIRWCLRSRKKGVAIGDLRDKLMLLKCGTGLSGML